MKKTIQTLAALTALFCAQNASALALPYFDYYDVDQAREILNSSNTSANGMWNISHSVNEDHAHDILGFDSALEYVTNAAVMFVFYEELQNGGFNVDKVVFNIGGFNLGSAPSAEQVVFDSVYFGSVYADILFDIQDDGELEWMVELTDANASVGLWSAILGVEVEAQPVPDSGSAFAFMGMAMFGLLVVRRRFAA